MKALVNSMTETEQALVRETEPARLAELDEDELADVHDRIRRARNKHVKLYRREGAARVETVGGRGLAKAKNRRNAQKAEVFEDALARVSRSLAKAARQAAAELKAERLRLARSSGSPGETAPSRRSAKPATRSAKSAARPAKPAAARRSADRTPAEPVRTKQRASTRAKGARRQAARDSRG